NDVAHRCIDAPGASGAAATKKSSWGQVHAGNSISWDRRGAGIVSGDGRPDRLHAWAGRRRRHPVAPAIVAHSLDRAERAHAHHGVSTARRGPISSGGDESRDDAEPGAAAVFSDPGI